MIFVYASVQNSLSDNHDSLAVFIRDVIDATLHRTVTQSRREASMVSKQVLWIRTKMFVSMASVRLIWSMDSSKILFIDLLFPRRDSNRNVMHA